MKLYKWIYTQTLEDWYFIKYDDEGFLGWVYDHRNLRFYHHNNPLGSAKKYQYSRLPKYQNNPFVEKKGWKIFLKKEARKARRKMIKDLFYDR